MKRPTFSLVATTLLAIAIAGCGNKDESTSKPSSEPAPAPTANAPAPTQTPPPAAPAPAEEGDYIRVLATHSEPKPTDPVVVSFAKWNVTKSAFDPANLEGGAATLEIDLSSLSTDSAKRDKHLQSPDYLDVAQFGTATIEINGVKKTGESTFTASAKVTARGITVEWPVDFEVLENLGDKIRIKGQKEFTRADFNLGKVADDSVAPTLTIEMQLSLTPQA